MKYIYCYLVHPTWQQDSCYYQYLHFVDEKMEACKAFTWFRFKHPKKYQKWAFKTSSLIWKPMVLASMLCLISELKETLVVIELPNLTNGVGGGTHIHKEGKWLGCKIHKYMRAEIITILLTTIDPSANFRPHYQFQDQAHNAEWIDNILAKWKAWIMDLWDLLHAWHSVSFEPQILNC